MRLVLAAMVALAVVASDAARAQQTPAGAVSPCHSRSFSLRFIADSASVETDDVALLRQQLRLLASCRVSRVQIDLSGDADKAGEREQAVRAALMDAGVESGKIAPANVHASITEPDTSAFMASEPSGATRRPRVRAASADINVVFN